MQGAIVDFAGSDPPFRRGQDKLGGTGPENPLWGYSYVPDTAGGTAFLYHLSVHGHLIRDLRLSARTVMEIFTGRVTNWDDPAITRDYGHQLPSLPIIPVVHSEGAGDTYFLTRWIAALFPGPWNAFCQRVHPGITPPCGPTEFYPANFGHATAENGSASVAGYVASRLGQGAIGYDEYAYALATRLPAVALRNPAGKYVLPTATNVSAALTHAIIDENARSKDFLQQDLTPVYTFTNPASYPLASYSYLIVPRMGTRVPPVFSNGAGRALSAFIDYALCQGQGQLAALGYAPLPANLVQGGLLQAARIPGHLPQPARCGT